MPNAPCPHHNRPVLKQYFYEAWPENVERQNLESCTCRWLTQSSNMDNYNSSFFLAQDFLDTS